MRPGTKAGAKSKGSNKMRDLRSIKKLLMGVSLGIVVLAGAAVSAGLQNVTREARQLQAAQRQAAVAYQRYQRTRRAGDYRNWQNAQARVQREQLQYQRAVRWLTTGGFKRWV